MRHHYGTVLEVDLSTGRHTIYELDDEVRARYIGGSGVAAWMLSEATGPDTDPLGPDNLLIFATSPLTGTPVPSSGRHAVVGKSPLTGIYCESDVGGYWGTNLRRAGFDILVVRGAAPEPVYLWIHDGAVELRPAPDLWGRDTAETDELVRTRTHGKAVTASIGPAGERLVLLSSIIHDGTHGRAAGRGGLGAVMGSKRLKSIAVFGERKIPVHDPEGLRKSIAAVAKDMRTAARGNMDFGTAGYTQASEELGDLPIKNWQLRKWSDVEHINGDALARHVTSTFHCHACFVGCGRVVPLTTPGGKETVGGGPEYESVACLGSNCLVSDMEAVIEANELCNRFGMDTISVGSAVAFAMEAYERGLLKGVSEYPVEWGSAESLLKVVRDIGSQQGIGILLGQGVKRAAEALGREAREFAIHSKGLEFPAHDPRGCASSYLGYATSNRGACHLQAFSHAYELGNSEQAINLGGDVDRYSDEGKAELVAKAQNLMCMYDAIKTCKFLLFAGIHVDQVLEWYTLATGHALTMDAFMEAGDRLFGIKRMYNQRCGVSRKDETIPHRILMEATTAGVINFHKMLSEYYVVRGYDSEGRMNPVKTPSDGR